MEDDRAIQNVVYPFTLPTVKACSGCDENYNIGEAEYDVTLVDSGPNKISVIRILRPLLPLSFVECKALVYSGNYKILSNVSKDEADKTNGILEEAGAEVRIDECSRDLTPKEIMNRHTEKVDVREWGILFCVVGDIDKANEFVHLISDVMSGIEWVVRAGSIEGARSIMDIGEDAWWSIWAYPQGRPGHEQAYINLGCRLSYLEQIMSWPEANFPVEVIPL
jgi:large subunit ribosomal protein L7/L12